jgi:hypothetical protein
MLATGADSALSWPLSVGERVREAIDTAMGFGRQPPAYSTVASALTAPALPASDCGIVFLAEKYVAGTAKPTQLRTLQNGMQYRRQQQCEAALFLYTCVRKGFLDTTVLNAGISFNERPENVCINAPLMRTIFPELDTRHFCYFEDLRIDSYLLIYYITWFITLSRCRPKVSDVGKAIGWKVNAEARDNWVFRLNSLHSRRESRPVRSSASAYILGLSERASPGSKFRSKVTPAPSSLSPFLIERSKSPLLLLPPPLHIHSPPRPHPLLPLKGNLFLR